MLSQPALDYFVISQKGKAGRQAIILKTAVYCEPTISMMSSINFYENKARMNVIRAIQCSLSRLLFFFGVSIFACAHGEVIPADDWQTYNKTLGGTRFSPLAQIDNRNVHSLKEICRIKISKAGSFHTGLVVIGDRMFFTNAHWTYAIDAKSCIGSRG